MSLARYLLCCIMGSSLALVYSCLSDLVYKGTLNLHTHLMGVGVAVLVALAVGALVQGLQVFQR